MSVKCPGCRAWIGKRSIACRSCRPLIPMAIREDLVRAHFAGVWWTADARWTRPYAAARAALKALCLPRARAVRHRTPTRRTAGPHA